MGRTEKITVNEIYFENRCKAYDEYVQKYGEIEIPHDYITNDGIRLGRWYRSINRQARRGSLEDCEIELLELYNVKSEVVPLRWDEWFRMAKNYKERPIGENSKVGKYYLGKWVAYQKQDHELLSSVKIAKLRTIGILVEVENSDTIVENERKENSQAVSRKTIEKNNMNYHKHGIRTIDIQVDNKKSGTFQKVSKGMGIFIDVINNTQCDIDFIQKEFYLVQKNQIINYDEEGYAKSCRLSSGRYKTVARIWKESSLVDQSLSEGDYIVFILEDITFDKSYICRFIFEDREWKMTFNRLKENKM